MYHEIKREEIPKLSVLMFFKVFAVRSLAKKFRQDTPSDFF